MITTATHHTRRLCATVIMMCALGFLQTSAQRSTTSLKGMIDQCHAVVVLDRNLPVDSLLVRPPLADSVRSAVLIGMVGSCLVLSDTQDVKPLGDLGRVVEVAVRKVSDSITIISPIDLDSLYRWTTYQMVVPVTADTVVIDSVVTARQWNGESGGIVFIRADSAIFFAGSIDVSGLGYAGGARSINGGDCGLSIPCDVAGSGLTGAKGDSPMRRDSLCRSGHRPWASGGGGGDAHNAGGGGGGNAASGGRGGNQFRCSPPPGMWGLPGNGVSNDSADLVLFGGGGGGGHQNNSAGTDGAAGGGIIVLRAPRLTGDTVRIRSTGSSVTATARNDGAGGGGAGGTIVIEACVAECAAQIDVSGGRGGDADGGHGPGGGGGGGFIIMQPALLQSSLGRFTINLDGGPSGTFNGQPSASNDAARGERGRLLALCSSVKPHSVMVGPRSAIGDTMRIDLIANDSTSLCECALEHVITLDGTGALALTSGTQLFTDVLLTTRTSRSSIAMQVVLPSRRSFGIPLLAVLSEDTTIDVRSSVALHKVSADQQCFWDGAEQTVILDACGRLIRKIIVDAPFRITAWVSPSREVTCEVDCPFTTNATIRVYNVIGTQMSEHSEELSTTLSQHSRMQVRFDAATWSPGVYVVVAHTSQGSRSIIVHL